MTMKINDNKKMKILMYLAIFINLFMVLAVETVSAAEAERITIEKSDQKKVKYRYRYIDRDHSTAEIIRDLAVCYGVSWVIYPIGQPEILSGKQGSWDEYADNLGRAVMDRDEPFWNLFVHPLMGSQLYLFNRANGYSKWEAFQMTFLTSLLFEFTVEIYSEPASLQDLYNTPVYGTILGVGLEHLSFRMLNSESGLSRFFGHLLNPSTLIWFYEGKIDVTPVIGFRDVYGFNVSMVF